MINNLISKLRVYRYKKYMAALIERGLKIGKNTTIGDGVFLDPSHCFLITIGTNCTLAPNVRLIAHDASMKRQLGTTIVGKITIHDNCFIGDSVIILPCVSVGPNALVGAGSVVTRDIPPGSVAAGNPAKVITTLDEFLRRHKEDMVKYRCFPEERYKIDFITAADREEMLSYLEKHPGYMEGKK